jgi:hypothetical protein
VSGEPAGRPFEAAGARGSAAAGPSPGDSGLAATGDRIPDGPVAAERLFALSEELGRLADDIAGCAVPAPAPALDSGFVRSLIRERRRRTQALGADLFADPVWDMMLDLLAARLEGREVWTSSLCAAAGVPVATALRWIRELTARGLFVRIPDPLDGAGGRIELSDIAAERLLGHLSAETRPNGCGLPNGAGGPADNRNRV